MLYGAPEGHLRCAFTEATEGFLLVGVTIADEQVFWVTGQDFHLGAAVPLPSFMDPRCCSLT